MEIDDACLDNPVALVHLEDGLILEGGDLEQLSSTVAMTAPNIAAKKARKHSNKGRSEKNKYAAANSIPCLLQGKVGKRIWKEGPVWASEGPQPDVSDSGFVRLERGHSLFVLQSHLCTSFAQHLHCASGIQYNIQLALAHESAGVLLNAQGIIVGGVQAISVVAKHWVVGQTSRSTMYPGEPNTVTKNFVWSIKLQP